MTQNYNVIYKIEQSKGSPKIEGPRARADLRYLYVRKLVDLDNTLDLRIFKAYPRKIPIVK